MIRVSLPVFVLLLFTLQAVVKSVWIPPRTQLHENVDYAKNESVVKIHSGFDNGTGNIVYSLEGIGANGVFIVDPETGDISVTQPLDRESVAFYNLSGVAWYKNRTLAEANIDIPITVVDENDNTPVFGIIKPGEVKELSPPGTSVMKITATDADEPGNINSRIAYRIIGQNPPDDMFHIFNNGTISVKKNTLDREKKSQYILKVIAQDLNGAARGKTGTTTVTIDILDVNDNLPTLEKEEYEGSIEENMKGVEVMRIKAEDLDVKDTENWEAVYDIVKGNEAGYFSIRTDPITNEGILMLDKAVDYEDVKVFYLGIAVRNKAPPYSGPGANAGGGGTIFKIHPIKINVKNKYRRLRFDPKVKTIPISKGGSSFKWNDVIAHYPAIDGDTGKPAENVTYVKGSDPDNWLTFDRRTAEIKLNKRRNRKSTFFKNGTYYVKVWAISEDMPGKPATGTVAIQVEDFNDHCPTLTSNIQSMCTPADSVIVNAKDEDVFPNGPPFDYVIVPEGTQGKWKVEHLNDTAAILRAQETMWPGSYEVEFVVKDQQGHACPEPQKVKVSVCTCKDGVECGPQRVIGQPRKEAQFRPAGIGLLFLGLLLLLLIPLLLLFCKCGGAGGPPGGLIEMPVDSTSPPTEGQGENTVPPLNMPPQVGTGMDPNTPAMATINYDFLRQYYTQKAASRSKNLGVKDSLLVYDYEGKGSPAGSVGCCSLLESDNNLQFLDDLGPMFKTLAEVCGGKKIQTGVKQEFTPLPSGMTTVNKGVVPKEGQMLLLQQQPVYYTTAPVLQPMQYVVQPQVQNPVLLAEAPPTNLQGMVLVNGTQGASANLIHTGNLSGTQTMMVVEGKVPAGSMKVLKGSQMHLVQGGTLQPEGLSGSQRVLVVGGPISSGGQLVQEVGGLSPKSYISGSQRVLYRKGFQSSMVASPTTTMSTTPTYHKVVVQETREIH